MTNEVEFGNITVEIVNITKEEKTMHVCLYDFIKNIILENEPDSNDEFEILDIVHDNLFSQPW